MKYLIINADDFGYSKIFNKSILNLIEKCLISSTTVMVNWITEEQQNQISKLINLRKNHKFSIGLHLEFNNSNFNEEIKSQYQKFIEIFNFEPTHVDVHKPTRTEEESLAVLNFCNDNQLPCRNLGFEENKIKMTSNIYVNGTDLSLEELEDLIQKFNDEESYEILFHPGTYDESCKSSLNKQRENDIKKIQMIFPKLSENQIKLINYVDLK